MKCGWSKVARRANPASADPTECREPHSAVARDPAHRGTPPARSCRSRPRRRSRRPRRGRTSARAARVTLSTLITPARSTTVASSGGRSGRSGSGCVTAHRTTGIRPLRGCGSTRRLPGEPDPRWRTVRGHPSAARRRAAPRIVSVRPGRSSWLAALSDISTLPREGDRGRVPLSRGPGTRFRGGGAGSPAAWDVAEDVAVSDDELPRETRRTRRPSSPRLRQENSQLSLAACVQRARTRRWLGLTATPYRRDKLEAIIGFHCGPTRHEIKPGSVAGGELVRRELVVHRTSTHLSADEADHIQSVKRPRFDAASF